MLIVLCELWKIKLERSTVGRVVVPHVFNTIYRNDSTSNA
jgi:hypothetical protein